MSNHNNSKGIAPIFVLALVGIIAAAALTAYTFTQPFGSEAQETSNRFILPPSKPNRDVQVVLSDPTSSARWDGIMRGEICFDVTPPSTGGSYNVAFEMPLKESPTSTRIVNSIIGRSVPQRVSNASTLRCSSRTRRDGVFNGPFNLPDKDLWAEECPEIKILLETQGSWKPIPQAEIGRLSREFVCPQGVPTRTPTTAQPTASPSAVITPPVGRVTPQTARINNPNTITGNISVFSCNQPKNVTMRVCDAPGGCTETSPIQTLTLSNQETSHGIWLDRNQPNTSTRVYKYAISKNASGQDLTAGADISFGGANAAIDTFRSSEQNFPSNTVTPNNATVPGTKDFTIDAQFLTCGCPFYARAYIKDADTNEILRITNSQIGTSNDMLIAKFGDKLFQTFNNGVIDVRADLFDYAERYIPNPVFPFSEHGIEGLASVRLYAPGYEVVKHECRSDGGYDACPELGKFYTRDTNSRDIQRLHISCGTNITYGWVVRKAAGAQSLSGVRQFSAEEVDIDKNGIVNVLDLSACVNELSTEEGTCDIDGNGITNTLDVVSVIEYMGESY